MNCDEFFLARAFQLARCGRFTTAPNPNVGCVIVRDGIIVGEGYHYRVGESHAEIQALKVAKNAAQGATVYVTLEPCNHYGQTPPCVDALINAGVSRVVAAMRDPNPKVSGQGFCRLQNANISVRQNLMLADAENINVGFLKRMRTGFPWITLKLAISLDGRTAMASGESKWITSSESRRDVQCFRAENDAILSTASTILLDNPTLNVRWSELPSYIQEIYPKDQLRQPVRVIIDSANRITLSHKIMQESNHIWLVHLYPDKVIWPEFVSQIIIQKDYSSVDNIDLISLMLQLGYRQINKIWIEAGPNLASALLRIGLVDELVLYQAMKLLGSTARSMCILSESLKLNEVPNFELIDIRQIGPDIRLRLKPL